MSLEFRGEQCGLEIRSIGAIRTASVGDEARARAEGL